MITPFLYAWKNVYLNYIIRKNVRKRQEKGCNVKFGVLVYKYR